MPTRGRYSGKRRARRKIIAARCTFASTVCLSVCLSICQPATSWSSNAPAKGSLDQQRLLSHRLYVIEHGPFEADAATAAGVGKTSYTCTCTGNANEQRVCIFDRWQWARGVWCAVRCKAAAVRGSAQLQSRTRPCCCGCTWLQTTRLDEGRATCQ